MGLSVLRVHFEKGLPSFEQIRKQFKKQTGLNIWMKVFVNLLELPLNNKEAVKQLNQDIEKYEKLENDEFFNEKESQKINHLTDFKFYSLFYGIDYRIEGKTIEIMFGIRRHYFASSLLKTMCDLGGEFTDSNDQVKEKWMPKHWGKLKKWNDYKWYNKPFICKS